jgi:hypothetical protein
VVFAFDACIVMNALHWKGIGNGNVTLLLGGKVMFVLDERSATREFSPVCSGIRILVILLFEVCNVSCMEQTQKIKYRNFHINSSL